ncbi:MAG TPA: hypothetical protein VHH93_05850, partial [Gammaproteobacteria bacterium]|nr:hypothetical protein [Gammaproteobacteria bacterium]
AKSITTTQCCGHDHPVTSQLQYQHSTWGFSVIELTTGEVLLEQSSDKLFVLTTHQFIQFAII